MSLIVENHLERNLTAEIQEQKEYRSAYLTIISFLKFADNGSLRFTEKYLKDRFSHRLQYRIMLDRLISHSILKKSDMGYYILNIESNNRIAPTFENSLVNPNKNHYKSDLESNFLYN